MPKFNCDVCDGTFPAHPDMMVETGIEYNKEKLIQLGISENEILDVVNNSELSKWASGAMCICLKCQETMFQYAV